MQYNILLKRNNIIIKESLAKLGYKKTNILLGNFLEGDYILALPSGYFITVNKIPTIRDKRTILVNCKEDLDLFLCLCALNLNNKITNILEFFKDKDPEIVADTDNLNREKIIYLEKVLGFQNITESIENKRYIIASSNLKLYAEGNSDVSNIFLDLFDPDIYVKCRNTDILFQIIAINNENDLNQVFIETGNIFNDKFLSKEKKFIKNGFRKATIEEIMI